MSAAGHAEIEIKYAVDEHTAVPDLAAVPGVDRVESLGLLHLEAVYFDTADRTLVRAHIALRRRTGGHDAGWHVKLPAAVGRTELQAPIDPAAPDSLPAAIRDLVLTRIRHEPLEPIARIATDRTATVVHDGGDGAVEVVDDRVTATDLAAGVVRTWREWEAEQVGEDEDASAALLAAVDRVLHAAGARVSPSPAKLAQALGGERAPKPGPATTAGEALRRVLARLVEQLHRDLAALRSGGAPEVHATRKTVRRLRSVLALTDVTGETGDALRARLRPLGATLGDARDPVVAAEVAGDLLDDLDPETPGFEDARRRLVDARIDDAEAARLRAVGSLSSRQDLALLADLDRFAAEGPSGPRAAAPVAALADLAQAAVRRAARRTRRADDSLEALHAARKAAKRARYVVEELDADDLLPARSALRKAAKRASRVHDAIGTHRDLALLVADLPFAAVRASAAGENAYVLGLLAERGAQRLTVLRRRAFKAVERFRATAR